MRRTAFLLVFLTIPLTAGSFTLFSDTLNLDVGNYRFIKFRITPEMAESTFISGEFFTEPLPTKIEFILITQPDYRRGWEGRGHIDTLDAVYAENGSLLMEIPGFGDFVLIVSNRGNVDPVVFAADLSVSFVGSGVTYDSLPFGMTLLMSLLAIGVVVAAVLLTITRMSSRNVSGNRR
ncbi:MAG: hypothetical protein KAR40_05905 [Candidatus Sabulitectum sp.]|nr:hypothetical protein [Candidatus Sabulitectum sp.]